MDFTPPPRKYFRLISHKILIYTFIPFPILYKCHTPFIYTLYTLTCCFPLSSPYFLVSLQLILDTPFISSYFINAQTAFHHCTFSFITAHLVHHCTLKQVLRYRRMNEYWMRHNLVVRKC